MSGNAMQTGHSVGQPRRWRVDRTTAGAVDGGVAALVARQTLGGGVVLPDE